MKLKLLAILIILTSILIPFISSSPVYAAISVNPLHGVVGSISYVDGLSENTTYSIKWNGAIIKYGTVSPGTAVFFNVPIVPRGMHNLIIENPVNTIVYSNTFYVNPSIEISPVSGVKDTIITVTGRGFASQEPGIRITYGNEIITGPINADFSGSFVAQFLAPVSTQGIHLVDAFGTITPPGEVADLSFIMFPSIKINPLQGCVGTMVEVSGSGFAAGESNIRVTFDGQVIQSGINAGPQGAWNTSFLIPETGRGAHKVDAIGTSTFSYMVQDVQFTVTASAFINPASGNVGDTITVLGKGFLKNESGITITYDDVILKRDINADDEGNWITSVNIPSSTAGLHNIGAYGDYTTSLNCSFTTLTVEPEVRLSPDTGNVGDKVTVSGTGFSANENLSISYGGNIISQIGMTQSDGNLFTSFEAPGGKHGAIEVEVSDTGGAIAAAIFNMETDPPPVPVLLKPLNGIRIGIIGSSPVSFEWSEVTDPSGVSYTLEISLDSAFNNIVFDIDDLADTNYTLGKSEALPHGEYFWRVRAVDGAANAGDWSGLKSFKISFISLETSVFTGIALAVMIILAIVLTSIQKAKKRK